MNTFKKIGLGMTFALLALSAVAFAPAHKTFAQGTPNFNLQFANNSNPPNQIDGTLNGNTFSFGVNPVNNSSFMYITGSPICAGSLLVFNGTPTSAGGQATTQNFQYKPTPTSACTSLPNGTVLAVSANGGGPPPAPKIDWTGATATLSSDNSQLVVTFSDGSREVFIDNNTADTTFVFKPQDAGAIGGSTVVSWCANTLLSQTGGDTTHGITIASLTATTGTVNVCYNTGAGQVNQTGISVAVQVFTPALNACSVYTGTPMTACITGYNAVAAGTADAATACGAYTGADLAACQAGFSAGTTAAGGGTGTPAPPSCESANTLGLEWIICPILRGIDSVVTSFYNFVLGQLCFNTGASSSAGGVTCSGGALLTPGVQQAWASFKDIATAILVVVALIMVMAQAFGGGPIDAYTIRKLLPKLIAVVIIMQFSYILAKWLIDLSNDAGQGISDLMYAPFNIGSRSIDLALQNIGATGVSVTAGIFATGAALAVFSGLGVVGFGLLALTGLAGVFIGFLVLFFRKMLILLTIMVMPIALACLILPGTERYWKLWRETFTKLLAMYPLIAALIAAGGIFGYIAGAASTGAIALISVLLGFFGPLFLLPKTYQWGGAALSGIGGAVVNGSKSIRNKPKDFAMTAAATNREQRRQDRAERLSYNESAHPRWDRFLAGRNNIALSRTARLRKYEENVAKGRQVGEEALVRSITGSPYENLDHPYKIDSLRTVAQGAHDARTGIDGQNPAAQRWALDELAKYGDWDIISQMRDRNQIDERTWQAWLAKNISAVHQNIPHLSPQRTDLSTQGYEEMPTYKDFEMTELREQAELHQVRDAQTGARVTLTDPDAILQHQIRHVVRARQALDDPQVSRRMTAHGIAELEAIAAMPVNTPAVQVVEGRHGRPQVVLPADLGTAEAQASINEHLSNPATRPHVMQVLGQRVAQANHTTPAGAADEAAFATYLGTLQAQAATSPEAAQLHAAMVAQLDNALTTHITETERAAVEAGDSAADIDTAVNEAYQHGLDKYARLGL